MNSNVMDIGYIQYEGDLLCFRVVLGPYPLELIQVVRAQNRPITRQVIKVVHDDSDKQVDDLRRVKNIMFMFVFSLYRMLLFFPSFTFSLCNATLSITMA